TAVRNVNSGAGRGRCRFPTVSTAARCPRLSPRDGSRSRSRRRRAPSPGRSRSRQRFEVIPARPSWRRAMSVTNQSIPVAVDRPAPRDTKTPEASGSPAPKPSTPSFTPPIDIHEGPDGLILEADLPGATGSNVSIQLEDNVLSLYAQVSPPAPEGA